jgi:hypothetical protein
VRTKVKIALKMRRTPDITRGTNSSAPSISTSPASRQAGTGGGLRGGRGARVGRGSAGRVGRGSAGRAGGGGGGASARVGRGRRGRAVVDGGGGGTGRRASTTSAAQRGHSALSSHPISRPCTRHQKRSGVPHTSHSSWRGPSCSTPQLGHRWITRLKRRAPPPMHRPAPGTARGSAPAG